MITRNTRQSSRRILRDMLSLPTAPFAEHMVVDYIERFCKKREGMKLTHDAAGNLLLRVRKGGRRVARPVCITAHLDHPGFIADHMVSRRRLRAFWRGGVPVEYFVGSRVRFWVDDSWHRGKVRSVKTVSRLGKRRVDTAIIDVPREIPTGSIGMWDLPDAKERSGRIYARACDDMAGAAAILGCVDRLVRTRQRCDAYFLFTRAEEVGFAGAIAAARLKTIPKKCFVVVMETSSQLPHAKMGNGPILRVGDRSSAYTPQATAHCNRIAADLARKDRRFVYQRKLMDGGTCEASAFGTLGYEATGICLALGNYHNVNTSRKRIGPEYVDLTDFDNAVKWFVALARAPHPYTGRDDSFRSTIREIERTYKSLLHASRDRPR